MESNWRMKVVDVQMQDSDWRLAARITGSPTQLLVVNPDAADPGKYRIYVALFSSLPTLVSKQTIPAAHPHFPYGVLVLPD